MSINTIKGEYYKTVEEELFVEKFRFLNFNNTSISRQDVVTFFTTNPDSFPQQERNSVVSAVICEKSPGMSRD